MRTTVRSGKKISRFENQLEIVLTRSAKGVYYISRVRRGSHPDIEETNHPMTETKMTTNEQIRSWKEQLPADLTYGTFEEDFEIDGIHYEHGAWDREGNYWMSWNTNEEFKSQFVEIEITA
jgi:hypothetical protein